MKVLRLQAENVKRLIAVDITPEGAVVTVTGKNGAGKSSVLDSIWYALGGERAIPGEPVRKGEKGAKVTLDLGDLIVERKWTEKGTYLAVTNKDGLKYPNPQKVLDALCGKLTFDPLEFSRQRPEDQAKTLAALVGLDLTTIEAKRKRLYDERRDLNRDVKRLEADCAQLPTDMPELLDVKAAEDTVRRVREQERMVDSHRQGVAVAETAHTNAVAAVERAEAELHEARRRVVLAKEAVEQTYERLRIVRESTPKPPETTLEEALRAVREANDSEAAFSRWQAAEKSRENLAKAKDQAQRMTDGLEALDQEAQAMIAACEFPLPGLSIVDGIVRFGDVPFEQCSSAEQLRISTAIAMRMNPKLRILRIADGSLLDHDSMRMLEQLAADQDYQVWLEVVESDDPTAVWIEDGQIRARAARTEEAA